MEHPVSQTSLLAPALIFLVAAVVAVPLFRLARMGAVVGYLAAGAAIGPAGLGLIGDPQSTLHIAEFGVVLLLFIIGLELEPARLLSMRRDIALLGAGQMIATALVLGVGLSLAMGLSARGAAIAALALAFSSTAIAMQLLDERGDTDAPHGRRAFAILLAQDVLVAPVLAAVPLLAGASALAGGWRGALISFAGVAAAFAIVVGAGRWLINPLLATVARLGGRETMTAAALLVVIAAALLMQLAGMSMALGAFLAGLLLSNSNFRHQLEADIEPFRGLLMGLFFMSVGMTLDRAVVLSNLGLVLGGALAVVLLKGLIAAALLRLTGTSRLKSLAAARVLTTAGEFSFVVFPVAAANGLMSSAQANALAAMTVATMVIGPLLAKGMEALGRRRSAVVDVREPDDIPEDAKSSALIIGFGRFGQLAVQVLLAGQANVTVIDRNTERIRNAARFGFKVYYGDGARLDVLQAAGADKARLIAICVDDRKQALDILTMVKLHFPFASAHVRAYDRIHAIELIKAGADRVTRETSESAIIFGGGAFATLTGDVQLARELALDVRRRDLERLSVQQSEGVRPGVDGPLLQPEPLTAPQQAARALSRETEEAVGGPDRPAATPVAAVGQTP